MSLSNRMFILAAPVALLALGACATPFRADVSRFQQMPAPQGQTFVVQANNARDQGGLEFQQYAGYVTQALVAEGYRPAASPGAANFVVLVDYGVDDGQQRVVTRPGFGYGGFGGGWGGGFGSPFYPRWGGGRFYGGWGDPFLFGGGWGGGWGGNDTYSYTVFTSHVELTINRTSDGQRLFEGRARARSTDDDLPRLVPSLVEALFLDFPGRSGEDVRITIPEGDGPARIDDRRRSRRG